MKLKLNNFKFYLLVLFLATPFFGLAAENFMEARVTDVLEQREVELGDETKTIQQNLRLEILEGDKKGEKITIDGIDDNFDLVAKNIYEKGNKVILLESVDDSGNIAYYISDYVRTNYLFWLAVIFIISVLVVGRIKGLKSLISLVITFGVIFYYIIPGIIAGKDPIWVTIVGSFFALLAVIYFTEGWNRKAHLAVATIFFSLLFTVALSWIFINLAKLTGISSEETGALISLGNQAINFKGLLLAAIIIGTLGVIDDVVIAQIATVEELKKADPYLDNKEAFRSAYRVGIAHISSMINTLFLAYAGAALPVLIILSSNLSAFSNLSQVINNEQIATEIVRTLTGSIGLILSVPLATFLASWFLKVKK